MSTVTDDFNRGNDASSMGSALTGQVWVPQLGTWGIDSNQAYTAIAGLGSLLSNSIVVIDAGMRNVIAQYVVRTLTGSPTLIFHYVDPNNMMGLHFRTEFNIWTYYEITGGAQTDVQFFNVGVPTPTIGDVMKVVLCDKPVPTVQLYQNDFLLFSANITHSAPFINSTLYGFGSNGTVARFDDFSVIHNDDCPQNTAQFVLPPIQWSASGSVAHPVVPSIQTVRFDAGLGSSWFLIPQLSDSGNELRSKTIKAAYVIGKLTNASIQVYGYDVGQPIKVSDLENGVRVKGSTRPQSLPDTTDVTQSARKPVNVVNAVVHTIRVAGDCTGETVMDRIDQVTYEQSVQGVRR